MIKKSPRFAPPLPAKFVNKLLNDDKGDIYIQIENMRLRTFIGINEWEQENRQDLVLNIFIKCNPLVITSCGTDSIEDTVNYKNISKEIIAYVENHRFGLLEKLTAGVLKIVLDDPLVISALVKGEKPGALRFSDSVGVEISGSN